MYQYILSYLILENWMDFLFSSQIESPRYTTMQYINERKKVEDGLFEVVQDRLQGVCCGKDCNVKGNWNYRKDNH